MKHTTLPNFWKCYDELPEDVQRVADKKHDLLKANSAHPSLQFKKVGKRKNTWSIRVGESYRALGLDRPDEVAWFWIGSHSEYDKIIS